MLEAEAFRVGHAADGDEHHIGLDGLRRAAGGGLEGERRALAGVLHLRDLGAELELEALLAEDALEVLGDLPVHAGQDAVEILDHGHLGAEAAPHGAELQADHAGADDHEALRHALELERAGGGDHDLLVDLDARQAGHVRARGDDDVLRLEHLVRAVLGRHLDLAGGGDARGAEEGIDLVLLEQELDALDVAVDALLLEGLHRLEIERRRANADAEAGEMIARLLEHVRGMQQGLRRNAADVEAGAAMGLALLDDGGLEAELGGPDGADIAAGAGADDDEIVGHWLSPLERHART